MCGESRWGRRRLFAAMDTDLRDILLCSELLEMHWRKTDAELKGYSSIAYNAMIASYKVELAKMGNVRAERY
jgi:hypothetical protein